MRTCLGPDFLFQLLHLGAGQARLVLNIHHGHVVQRLGVVFLLPLLAAEEEGFVLAGEAVLQDAVDEIGLAGIQEPGHQINGNIHERAFPFPAYRPKSRASLSSFSSAPMTQRRPV